MLNSKTKKFSEVWDVEAGSYRFNNDTQADYLANFYHLSKCLGIVKNKRILEVGSGSGQMSGHLASQGGLIHLVDISKKSLMFAKNYLDSKNLPVKIYLEDAFTMKFPKNSFDIVWNGEVIEHFEDDEKIKLIQNMWSLIKPGGILYITVPNARGIPFIIAKRILIWRKKWAFGKEDAITKEKMNDLAVKAGVNSFLIYAYNPIVGYWFFPYGREVTNLFRFNTLDKHKKVSRFGHVLVLVAKKK